MAEDLWIDVRDYGAVCDGNTDDATAVQDAINSKGIASLPPNKTCRVYSRLVIGDGEALFIPRSATLYYTGTDVAIEVQGNGHLFGGGKIRKTGTWDTATGILASGSRGIVEMGAIEGFQYGVYLKGDGQGAAYNNINIGYIKNCIQGIKLDAINAGWVNQNYIHFDCITITTSQQQGDHDNWELSYGIYIDSQTSHAPNANRFSGSIESVHTGVLLRGNYNRLDGLRLELLSTADYKIIIENTTGGSLTDNNWWFGEYGLLNWINTQDIGGGAKSRTALQIFGMRGIPPYIKTIEWDPTNDLTSRDLLFYGKDGTKNPRVYLRHWVDLDDNIHYFEFDSAYSTTIGYANWKFTHGALTIPRITTAVRDALTPENGMMIYNSIINQFQCYENSAWHDFGSYRIIDSAVLAINQKQTLVHGLGVKPSEIQVSLLCVEDNAGWTANDEIFAFSNHYDRTYDRRWTVGADATNIITITGADFFSVHQKTTPNNITVIKMEKWKFRIRYKR